MRTFTATLTSPAPRRGLLALLVLMLIVTVAPVVVAGVPSAALGVGVAIQTAVVGAVGAVVLLGPSRLRYVVDGDVLRVETMFGGGRWPVRSLVARPSAARPTTARCGSSSSAPIRTTPSTRRAARRRNGRSSATP